MYATRAWTAYGEGPTKMGGGSFTNPTRRHGDRTSGSPAARTTPSCTPPSLGWPGSTLTIKTLGSNQINLCTLTSVQLLEQRAGTYINLPTPTQDTSGLHVTMPSSTRPTARWPTWSSSPSPARSPPWALRRLHHGWVRIANVTSGLVLDSGGSVASGSNLKQWNYDGSTNLQWQLVDLGNGYFRIVNRTNGMVADSWGNTANGAPALQSAWNGGNNQQWSLNSVGNSRYQIVNRGTGTALDGSGSTTAGSTTVMWAPNSSTNNQWTIHGV